MHTITFTAGEGADLFLLVAPGQVETRYIGTRIDQSVAQRHLLLAARNLFPDRLVGIEIVARLINVRKCNSCADGQHAGVGLFLTDNHAEEGGLASTIWSDDTDNGPGGYVKGQTVVEQMVAIAFRDTLGANHHITQA